MDLILCPSLLWAGSAGYPDSAIPRPGAGAGLLMHRGIFTGGLSLSWDYDAEKAEAGPLFGALELSCVTPLNLVLFVSGGAWYRGNEGGAFFGVGLGIIY
jgi:hypothetical protein